MFVSFLFWDIAREREKYEQVKPGTNHCANQSFLIAKHTTTLILFNILFSSLVSIIFSKLSN